jgi:hypothetical protein
MNHEHVSRTRRHGLLQNVNWKHAIEEMFLISIGVLLALA